jgi:hypothetical protein
MDSKFMKMERLNCLWGDGKGNGKNQKRLKDRYSVGNPAHGQGEFQNGGRQVKVAIAFNERISKNPESS